MKPQPFGRYLLLDKVASGGMAEVWRAKLSGESGFQRIVAIKKILPHVCEDQDFITMFTDEAKITVQLQHSNIGQVYEFDKVDGLFYIAMEYISGKDVKTIWSYQRSRKTTIPHDYCCYIVQKMSEGLDYAHRKKDNFGNELGIIHRDVSPQNCIMSWDGEIKVIDFGIAKAAEKGGHTRAGTLKGKFAYMSPEQIRGLPLDGRADVFALGVCLYELVTGERGFQAESEFSLLEMVRNVEIKPPTMVNKDIPQELERIIFKALAKDREHRYPHGSDLAEDLQRFLLNKGKPPRAQDVGKFLRENFTVDYDKERLRLESYKEIEWSPPKIAAEPAPAQPLQIPVSNNVPAAPPPSSLTAVQAALAMSGEGTGTGQHGFGDSSFASADNNSGTFASPQGNGVAGAGGQPSTTESTGGYVISGHREEMSPTGVTQTGIRGSMNVTLPGAPVPQAPEGAHKSGAGFKIAAALFLVLALGGAAAAAFVFAKATGTVSVTVSGPPEAQILLDGEPMGKASPSLTLSDVPEGKHDLIVQQPGSTYQAFHLSISVPAGKVLPIQAEMQQAPGRFNISSRPLGAKVYLDGQFDDPVCERTPCQISAAGGMNHQISTKLDGYKDGSEEVSVKPAETKDLTIVLKPISIEVTIRSVPSGAKLKINGKSVGKTPYVYTYDPDIGSYPKALLSKKGCKRYDTSLPITDDKAKQKFSFELECR